MTDTEQNKDTMIRLIQKKAERNAAALAGQFARAPSEEKEELLASLELEKELAETCRVCLDES